MNIQNNLIRIISHSMVNLKKFIYYYVCNTSNTDTVSCLQLAHIHNGLLNTEDCAITDTNVNEYKLFFR